MAPARSVRVWRQAQAAEGCRDARGGKTPAGVALSHSPADRVKDRGRAAYEEYVPARMAARRLRDSRRPACRARPAAAAHRCAGTEKSRRGVEYGALQRQLSDR